MLWIGLLLAVSLTPASGNCVSEEQFFEATAVATCFLKISSEWVPPVVRLMFHDCLPPWGCDGCLSKTSPDHKGLQSVQSRLLELQQDYIPSFMSVPDFWVVVWSVALRMDELKQSCPELLAHDHESDIKQCVTDIQVCDDKLQAIWNQMGFTWGRRSCDYETKDGIEPGMPSAYGGVVELNRMMVDLLGLSMDQIVALSGAHTLGSKPNKYPGVDSYLGRWTPDPYVLDNAFYTVLVDEENIHQWKFDSDKQVWRSKTDLTMLNTDVALLKDTAPSRFANGTWQGTPQSSCTDGFLRYCPDAATAPLVRTYATDNKLWLEDFRAASYVLMTNFGPDTYPVRTGPASALDECKGHYSTMQTCGSRGLRGNSATFLAGKFILGWEVQGDKLHVDMKVLSRGWAGFGLGETMAQADIVQCSFDGNTPHCSDRWNHVARSEPESDVEIGGTDDLTDIGGEIEDIDGVTWANYHFSRPLVKSDDSDRAVDITAPIRVIVAFSDHANFYDTHGVDQRAQGVLDLVSGQGTVFIQPANIHYVHGLTMVITYAFMYPAGVIIARYFKATDSWAFRHATMMKGGAASSAYLGLSMFAQNGFLVTMPHHWLGLTIIFFVCVQIGLGMLTQWKSSHSVSRGIRRWHKIIGWCILLSSVAQGYMGIKSLPGGPAITDPLQAAWLTWFVLIAALCLAFETFGCVRNSRAKAHFDAVQKGEKPPQLDRDNSSRLGLIGMFRAQNLLGDNLAEQLPTTYTWKQIRDLVNDGRCLVVINNIVCDVRTRWAKSHPGGKEVLRESVGTDRTPSFFGFAEPVYAAQELSDNSKVPIAHKHSGSALQHTISKKLGIGRLDPPTHYDYTQTYNLKTSVHSLSLSKMDPAWLGYDLNIHPDQYQLALLVAKDTLCNDMDQKQDDSSEKKAALSIMRRFKKRSLGTQPVRLFRFVILGPVNLHNWEDHQDAPGKPAAERGTFCNGYTQVVHGRHLNVIQGRAHHQPVKLTSCVPGTSVFLQFFTDCWEICERPYDVVSDIVEFVRAGSGALPRRVIEIAVKIYDNNPPGVMSTYLDNVQVGETVRLRGPVPVSPELSLLNHRNEVDGTWSRLGIVVAGTGATSIVSLLRWHLTHILNPNQKPRKPEAGPPPLKLLRSLNNGPRRSEPAASDVPKDNPEPAASPEQASAEGSAVRLHVEPEHLPPIPDEDFPDLPPLPALDEANESVWQREMRLKEESAQRVRNGEEAEDSTHHQKADNEQQSAAGSDAEGEDSVREGTNKVYQSDIRIDVIMQFSQLKDIIFKDFFDQVAEDSRGRIRVTYMLSRTPTEKLTGIGTKNCFSGKLLSNKPTDNFLKERMSNVPNFEASGMGEDEYVSNTTILLCGPNDFMTGVSSTLRVFGYPSEIMRQLGS